jgi:hypothetical protein
MAPIKIFIDKREVSLFPLKWLKASNLHCWGGLIGSSAIIQSSVIDSQAKALELLNAAQELQAKREYKASFSDYPLRLLNSQLSNPDYEWEDVLLQRTWLNWLSHKFDLSAQSSHLSYPLASFIPMDAEKEVSEFLHRDINRLRLLYNMEGLETLCYWLHEKMEKILEGMRPDSPEIYTLEGLLKDFIHETRSILLLNEEDALIETTLELGALEQIIPAENPKGELAELEKKQLKALWHISESLKIQEALAAEIVRVIASSETAEKEFASLKNGCELLKAILHEQIDLIEIQACPSWSQGMILLQLVSMQLSAIHAVSVQGDLGRRNFAFAVQIAVAILAQQEPMEDCIDLACHWDETSKTSYVKISEMGWPEYQRWLSNSGDELQKKRLALCEQLRRLVLQAIDRICIPLINENAHRAANENIPLHPDCLDLLPFYGEFRNFEDEVIQAQLIKIKDGSVFLTPEGNQLCLRLQNWD